MTYRLLIGQRSYSSWSLRGWLPFEKFDIPVEVETTLLYSDAFASDVAAFGGRGTVPTAKTASGAVLPDSLAIAWHLAEAFPEKNLLPTDEADRIEAIGLIAMMHTGFTALRSDCPMNLVTAWEGYEAPEAVRADLAKLDTLWGAALERSGGPFLYGDYSLADVFYAPVATRIATYGLPVAGASQRYVQAHLNDLAFRRWRAMGLAADAELSNYDKPLSRKPFPAAPTIPAEVVTDGSPENSACPYSGGAPTYLANVNGRVFGFCNAFCRDKTVNDPEAWPAFMAIYDS